MAYESIQDYLFASHCTFANDTFTHPSGVLIHVTELAGKDLAYFQATYGPLFATVVTTGAAVVTETVTLEQMLRQRERTNSVRVYHMLKSANDPTRVFVMLDQKTGGTMLVNATQVMDVIARILLSADTITGKWPDDDMDEAVADEMRRLYGRP